MAWSAGGLLAPDVLLTACEGAYAFSAYQDIMNFKKFI